MQIIPAWIDRMGGAAVFDCAGPGHIARGLNGSAKIAAGLSS